MKFSAIVILVIALTVPMHATTADGSWSTLNAGSNYGRLLDAGGAGDWIWFLSQFGVGRVHRTGSQPSFSYFTDLGLKIPIYNYRLVIVDSVTVALYGGGYDFCDITIIKNVVVRTIRCPEIPRTLICESAGGLWVGADSALYRFDGSEWSRHAYNPVDSVAATMAMVVDRNGSVFFTSGNGYIGQFDGTTISRLNVKIGMAGPEWFADLFIVPNGNPMVLTSSALYDIRENTIVTEISLNPSIYTNDKYHALDSVGNLWYYRQGGYNDTLLRYSIASGKTETIKTMNNARKCLLFANTSGICYYSKFLSNGTLPGFVSIINNSGDSATIIYNQLPHNEKSDFNSAEIFYFNGGSIAYQILSSYQLKKNYTTDSSYIVRYEAFSCDTLPPLAPFARRLFDHPDGYLYAGTDGGLFRTKGAVWEKMDGLSDIPIVNMTVDSSGQIWGVSYDVFFHQTDRGWDIIDQTNSNLPVFRNDMTGWYNHQENGVILIDSANTVWAILDSSFASTADGHHWDIYPFSELGIMRKPSSMGAGPYLYKNSEGAISFVGRKDSLAIIRGTLTAAGIRRDTLSPPDSLGYTLQFIDCGGGIWAHRGPPLIGNPRGGFLGLYRYYNNQWFTYDSSNAPITWALPYSEMSPGKIQMITEAGEIVFNYAPPNDVQRSQPHFKHSPPGILSLSSQRKSITVNCFLSSNSPILLSLFDVRGRLVKILDERKGMRGTFFSTYTVNYAPGLYFVRLTTPEGSQVSRIIMR